MDHQISRLGPQDLMESAPNDELCDGLAEVLYACVHGGASVGFVLPFSQDEARRFWSDKVLPQVMAGGATLWVAHSEGRALGTVQLHHDLPPNQPHRADVAKLLVHPDARRNGLGRALMDALEVEAHALHKRLLVLDTRSGDASQTLYENMGFTAAGTIPGYCLNPFDGRPEATTYLFKPLTTY